MTENEQEPRKMPDQPTVPTPAEEAPGLPPPNAVVLAEARRRSRRSFIGLGLAGLAGLGGWRWLLAQPDDAGIPHRLRNLLDFNGALSSAYYQQTRLAPEFARSRAQTPRENGNVGLADALDPATWRLRVEAFGSGQPQEFTLADIKALPQAELTTELKCIEGWSTVVHWTGVRLADFLARYPLATYHGERPPSMNKQADPAPYVGMRTPDGSYYVGIDMDCALHPQTLLCYAMNGQPLSAGHGAPLRLVTPLKYGIKHLKRIGTIFFSEHRPKDYWAELGYDWDAGH